MSLRHTKPPDSLELLLDTMCNLFGGIVLLAVLVTLLAKQEKGAQVDANVDSRAMLQRRIARVEAEQDDLRRQQDELEAQIAADPAKERLHMVSERKRLQRQLDLLREQAIAGQAQATNAPSSDPAERLRQLEAEKKAIELQRGRLENSRATIEEAQRQMLQREKDLQRQLAETSAKQVQALRLPQERETGKRAFWILVKHGQLYPLLKDSGVQNDESISWTQVGTDSSLPTPLAGRGVDPAKSPTAFRRIIQSIPEGKYVAFIVWEDSFGAFNAAKQLTVATKREYGWDPHKQDEKVTFGPRGSRPSAQ